MPAQILIHLSLDEATQLKKNIRSRKTPVRILERSKIVLLAAKGIPNYQIASTLQIDVNKVGRWRNRFAERRLAGIEKDLPRGANHGGKNSAAQAKLRSKIIALTTQAPPDRRHPLVDPRASPRPRDQPFLRESSLAGSGAETASYGAVQGEYRSRF